MKTHSSDLVQKLLRGATDSLLSQSDAFGSSWARRKKPFSLTDHFDMCAFLRAAPVDEIDLVGRGIHRPWKVTFKSGYKIGPVTCNVALFKTLRSVEETNYYLNSTDNNITPPEREIAAYALDRALGFNLVPPTVGRELFDLGFGSLQAWVLAPLAIDWKEAGYNFREDYENPWLHLLCVFDFIIGSLDRHSGNFIFDTFHRVYAIDNGYSFVKDDIRDWLKCNIGRRFRGQPIHPYVRMLVGAIDPSVIETALQPFGFRHGEIEGAIQRLEELKKKEVWDITNGHWGDTL